MPYFDPSTMRLPQSPSAVESIGSGLKLKEMFQQQQQYQRQQGFMQAIGEIVQSGVDYKTPEGQQKLVQGLAAKGYGAEAFDLAQKFPKQQGPEYQLKEVGDDYGKWDPSTGTFTKLGSKTPKPAEDKWSGTTWVTSGGKKVLVDANGLDKNGKPVIQDKEPKDTGPKGSEIFTQEQQLRTQYLGQTKDYRDVRDAYSRIQVSAKDPSAAGDLALIFNYMKMLDPGSTVREGEFANAQNAGGIPDRIYNTYNKALNGERLNPSQRADFMNRAKGLYSKAEFQKKKTQAEYRRVAGSYPGLNADRILMDDAIAADPSEAAPAMPTFEQYDSLPSGAEFTDPEGNVRRKP